jgi:D-sedoheptulose 7-phosphate isomerase
MDRAAAATLQQPQPPLLDPELSGGLAARLFARNLMEHRALFDAVDALQDAVCDAALRMADTLARGGKLLFLGNGGSASDSLHLAAELSGRLRTERQPLPALALCADSAALTAIANDYGYEQVFARQVRAHARAGDCVIGISTSGRSPNVLRAFEAAGELGASRIALLGCGGGAAAAMADVALVVPSAHSARIQEAHIFIGHTLCGQIEVLLGLVP